MTNGPSRVVLITGASSGIGRATAQLLAGRGHQVFGGVRAPATTPPLAGVAFVPLDVRNEPSVKACIEEVRSRAGRIDALINNAVSVWSVPSRKRASAKHRRSSTPTSSASCA
jgi:NAD(P)-dependent dehydrogenase (short-subunit alcohol dehydrogenase family)